ncbi:MAG: acyl-[acyl-carrier-protein]--UDP-N-acetylglucosamine O-acyltransferase, partial [Arcobacteraceae bacterium]|nr:acyl-[acyl-carrier-protein]--UDP-N-acetylglucosamine O-acyltransferase [Arcobacteraceae bacterium]
SVLTQDIPPFCLAEGNRAVLRGLNLNGLRRRFENRADIDAIKKAYKQIFESGNPIVEVAKEILENSTNEQVIEFAQFIINTKRGIPFTRK